MTVTGRFPPRALQHHGVLSKDPADRLNPQPKAEVDRSGASLGRFHTALRAFESDDNLASRMATHALPHGVCTIIERELDDRWRL